MLAQGTAQLHEGARLRLRQQLLLRIVCKEQRLALRLPFSITSSLQVLQRLGANAALGNVHNALKRGVVAVIVNQLRVSVCECRCDSMAASVVGCGGTLKYAIRSLTSSRS